MADLLKKGIQSIASILPGRDNRRNETVGEISGPVDIHYGCDGCGKGIKVRMNEYNYYYTCTCTCTLLLLLLLLLITIALTIALHSFILS